MAHVDRPAFTEDRCPFQDIAKLSHVAGPRVWSSAARASRVSSAAGRPKDLPIPAESFAQRHDVRGRSRSGGIWMSKTPMR